MIYYTETRSVHLVISSGGRSMVTGVDCAYISNFAVILYDHTHRVIEMYFRDKQFTIFVNFDMTVWPQLTICQAKNSKDAPASMISKHYASMECRVFLFKPNELGNLARFINTSRKNWW